MSVRFGRHDDYDRLVFDWSASVAVNLVRVGDEVVITFDRPAEVELPPESAFTYRADSLPQSIFGLTAEGRGQQYRIEIDPDVDVVMHRWNDDRLIVIDLFRRRDENAAAVAAGDGMADNDLGTTSPVKVEQAETVDGDDQGEDDKDAESEGDFSVGESFGLSIGATLQFGVTTAEGERLSDGDGDRGFAFFTDNDIDIEAFATGFDGVDIGASITLEADADAGGDTANADETYIYFSNGFGDVQLGRTSGAEDDMALGADTIAAGTGGIDGDTENLGDTQVETTGDAAKISYFTPRIKSVQLGISYTPDTGDSEGENDQDRDLENHIGIGLNVVDSIGDVEFGVAAVGSFGESEFSDSDDLSAFSIGGTAEVDAVEFGASYGQIAEADDFDFATLGITFGLGEASAGLGYNYFDEKSDGVTHIFALSGDALILPDVELQGDLSYADPEGRSGNIASVFAVELSF